MRRLLLLPALLLALALLALPDCVGCLAPPPDTAEEVRLRKEFRDLEPAVAAGDERAIRRHRELAEELSRIARELGR
jgi:hypothetical protein